MMGRLIDEALSRNAGHTESWLRALLEDYAASLSFYPSRLLCHSIFDSFLSSFFRMLF